MSKIDYAMRIQSLNERKEKLIEQKTKIENSIKDIDAKIKQCEKAQTVRDIDKTVILLKKTGLSMGDIVKAIDTGNFEDIKVKITRSNEDSSTSSNIENFS